MLDLLFEDKTGELTAENEKMLQDLLTYAANYMKLEGEIELSLTIVDDKEIHAINKEYRNIDRPTDVISFAIEDQGEDEMEILGLPDDLPRELGDLFISIDKVREQAVDYGHSFERELGFLALHGFLHLNGYDHMEEADEKEMFGLQKEILDAYGLKRD
ncbi:rRNA maturation RNase YbeY [Aerococcus agrisoli]|uniref:Endoribonuclease YbeY n=2 Tax=Aerococcus agrisoli TaxID=2487350 RepID=A0A3N4HAD5_9LACT|nr:rRNA maturation RNase YbeY [Aerococcus agrisoli]